MGLGLNQGVGCPNQVNGSLRDCLKTNPRASRGVPNLNVGTDVPLSFTAFGRVIKPPAMRVVVYSVELQQPAYFLSGRDSGQLRFSFGTISRTR
jgi:hypothetical protein